MEMMVELVEVEMKMEMEMVVDMKWCVGGGGGW